MQPLILAYKNLIFQSTLSFLLSLLLYFVPLPSLFLQGLNTYIHPDDVNPNKPQSSAAPRVAIRRPSDPSNQGFNEYRSLSSRTASELRNRKKSLKDRFEFDETNAQIFRLKLGDAQLVSRLFFDSFRSSFNCLVVVCCCFFLQLFLNVEDGSGVLRNGSLVPILLGVLGVFRVFDSLVRVSLERSAFRISEKQLGLLVGLLGFVLGLVITSEVFPSIVDFGFERVDGYGSLFVALLCGSIAGFLYIAAGKNARAFWLGTDQIRCNLSIISCQWFAQVLLYASYLVMTFTSLLWINLFSELLVNNNIGSDTSASGKLVGNVGIARGDFIKFRIWSLLASGVLQALAVRPNLQMYLNEAVLSWYQRLHASRVPDLEYSRAKVFLHNHYLCLTVLQFFAPAALLLLFLGLSQVGGGVFDNFHAVCGILPCSAFVGEVGLFMAWWVAFYARYYLSAGGEFTVTGTVTFTFYLIGIRWPRIKGFYLAAAVEALQLELLLLVHPWILMLVPSNVDLQPRTLVKLDNDFKFSIISLL
ncbi:hypothetical protein Dimus_000294 [Dionaea muscipula]